MEIGERLKLVALEEELQTWADRYKNERIKYSKARRDLGIILASKPDIKESFSFENKCIALMAQDKKHNGLWIDYVKGYDRYKAAYILWQTIEHKINNLKFINRPIV